MLTAAESRQFHLEFEGNILHVVTAISNPKRYASRYRLHDQFRQYILGFANVRLTTVELSFGDRGPAISALDPRETVLHFRSDSELWHKENLINLGVASLPAGWKYMAWIDADVSFARSDWSTEILHLLQHHKVVQMFGHAEDLGPDMEPIQRHSGLLYRRNKGEAQGRAFSSKDGKVDPYASEALRISEGGYAGHPGYAWAMRREAYDGVGGLLDTAILGAGDHHMALGMLGIAERSLPRGMGTDHPYAVPIMLWQERALSVIRGDVGYMPGLLLHYWHGKKADRRYQERWEILMRNEYDPARDVVKDAQGVLRLTGNKPQLRDDLRRYMSARNEDSIDL